MAQRNDGHITHERIVLIAARLFAERGYNGATLGEICNAAEVNGAAVNYHFGSKEGLYREIWQREIDKDIAENPSDGGVSSNQPMESRLRGRINAMIRRFFTQNGQPTLIGMLLTREMAAPTGLIDDLKAGYFRPQINANRAIVREFLGDDASERDVLFAQTSIVHQCLALGLRRTLQAPGKGPGSSATDHPMSQLFGAISEDGGLEALIDHVTRFSIAGLEATRNALQTSASTLEELSLEASP